MAFVKIDDMEARTLIPGTASRFIHTPHMTIGYWLFEPGVALPEHSHPHEQVSNVIEGDFEFTMNGQAHRLEPGGVAVIPPGMPHSGRAITRCRIIDVFYPVREDFK